MSTLTGQLAALVLETPAAAIGQRPLEAARKMVLDTLGTALAGWNEAGVPAVREQALDWGGKPEARLLVSGRGLPAPNAVFVNSAAAHALDYDDMHLPTALHLMCQVMPAALAAAEMAAATGRAFLEAVVLGVEASCRLGLAYQRRRSGAQGPGFLPSSLIGGFGAAGAAARLLGLGHAATVDALGLNYAQAAGNRQALYDKTLAKRLQPAFAARSAFWAVMLARRGISGPPRALEGPAGLFRIYQDAAPPAPEELFAPRDFFEIERTVVKRYTACGAAHILIQAALDLAREHDLQAGQIAGVELYMGEGGNRMVGMPFRMGANPQVNAQFSVAYGVALALLRRRAGLAEFTDRQVRADTAVADLAARVRILEHLDDPPPARPLPPDWPAYTGRAQVLFVRTADGRRLERVSSSVEYNRPVAEISFAAVAGKFRECAAFSRLLSAPAAEAVVALVRAELDRQPAGRLIERLADTAGEAGGARGGNG